MAAFEEAQRLVIVLNRIADLSFTVSKTKVPDFFFVIRYNDKLPHCILQIEITQEKIIVDSSRWSMKKRSFSLKEFFHFDQLFGDFKRSKEADQEAATILLGALEETSSEDEEQTYFFNDDRDDGKSEEEDDYENATRKDLFGRLIDPPCFTDD
jgi:hypothetical protein